MVGSWAGNMITFLKLGASFAIIVGWALQSNLSLQHSQVLAAALQLSLCSSEKHAWIPSPWLSERLEAPSGISMDSSQESFPLETPLGILLAWKCELLETSS